MTHAAARFRHDGVPRFASWSIAEAVDAKPTIAAEGRGNRTPVPTLRTALGERLLMGTEPDSRVVGARVAKELTWPGGSISSPFSLALA